MPNFKLLLLASALATPAFAAPTPTSDSFAQQASDPDTIIVTALRTPTPLTQVASAITVLDKAAIDASQQFTVSDLIVRTPGVTGSRTGGFGTTTGIRIRGAESDQTVVVIDGVKLNDPSAPGGGYDFGDLFVGDAAQIEVLRGPQSTLWGSQAIGGVVNIVTALPTAGLQGSAEAEGGSRGTASGKAAIGGASNGIRWQLAGNAFRTDGISAIAPEFGGHEHDGYRHIGTSGRVLADIAPDISLDVRGYWSHGKVDLDSSFGPPDTPEYQKSTNWIGYAGLNVALFDGRLKNRIAVTRDHIDRDNYDPSAGAPDKTFASTGNNDHIEYQGSLAIVKGWDATFGAEHEHSRFTAISPQFQTDPDRGNVSIDSVYGQLNGTIVDHLTLTGGVRYDHHQTYGGHALVSGGAVWSSGGTTVRASYGEGFKAPTLYQLYSAYGNLNLNPERAHGWDAGIEQKLGGHFTASLTWFDRDTHNLIEFAGFPPRADRPFGYYQNVDKTNAHGIEAAAAARFGGLTLDANYTWTDAEDRSPGATHGNDLIRRPRGTANADATYAWAFGLTTIVAVTHASHSFEDSGNTIRLDGYTLVDFRAEQPIGHGLSLFGRVENIGNTHYETAYEFGSLGRSFYGGVRAKF
ncbi:MAG TPA: TonB-dependent receptor [Sphingomonas sp.]|uniref:TonB-dependent receptor plug domain-containing protein n=1 Tax=Sphingomonas sp. TaxID=28214 RepID=UPI002BCF8F8A|nr:TonB-dependent receptor [Sphingomonas sp.]HMI19173.1 TonB-dependent receptor [Sphingomonas sp.]